MISAPERPWPAAPRSALLALTLVLAAPAAASAPTADPIFDAMSAEIGRAMNDLRLGELPRPYFISYRVDDYDALQVTGEFGSLTGSYETRSRWLTVEVRVGDRALDNSNYLWFSRGSRGVLNMFGGRTVITLDDDPLELRRTLWLATDDAYKEALERFSLKRAALENKTRSEEIPDFSEQQPVEVVERAEPVGLDRPRSETLVRRLSAVFRELPAVHASSVRLSAGSVRSRYINSEGSRYDRTTPTVELVALATTQAADGLPLDDFRSVYARRIDDLPETEELASKIRRMGLRMAELVQAPPAERYNGPVLFEGQAAAELFAQGLAPLLLASRIPVADNPRSTAGRSESLEEKLGARVLPRFLRVEDDPTLEQHDGLPLLGSYDVDDEGVPAGRTTLIERGILKTLLADRTPVSGVLASTGNARAGAVMPSNLFVTAEGGIDLAELKRELLLEIADRELEYGLIVRRVGNPRLRERSALQFPGGGPDDVTLTEVYRVLPDGREDLVRNAVISGLDAASFKAILAASSERAVYTAPFRPTSRWRRSAGATVSWIVPSLLFEDLTINRPTGEIPRPPVAVHPFFERKASKGEQAVDE